MKTDLDKLIECLQTNPLDEIVKFLQRNPLRLWAKSISERTNSSVNESEVLKYLVQLKTPTGYHYVFPATKSQAWYDFKIQNPYCPDNKIFVNIKITNLDKPSADNVSAKQGMGYALTGIEDMPKEWDKFHELLRTQIELGFDYYFLIINKNNTSDCFWTSLKRIETLVPNGNNLPFQCNWSQNKFPINRNEIEATDYILSIYNKSCKKRAEKFQGDIEWKLHPFSE